MLFESVCSPDRIAVETGDETLALAVQGDQWMCGDIVVSASLAGGKLALSLHSPSRPVSRVHLTWGADVPPATLLLGDHWERGYGDLAWQHLAADRPMPWYMLASDGSRTCGYGVMTSPGAFCCWLIGPTRLRLTLDVRSGRQPVQLGERTLEMATVTGVVGEDGQSPFSVATELCRRMCPAPRPLAEQAFGFNDWYYIYGKNSRETVLRDANLLAELAPDGNVRPFCVIDDGWQVSHAEMSCNGGPWTSNREFGDMAALAAKMRDLGTRPGIWLRPLSTVERVPTDWLRQPNPTGEMHLLDPSVPDVLELIATDVRRICGEWGYELIKHDFSTYDIFCQWGMQMRGNPPAANAPDFADNTRTTAEIIRGLYAAIREAAGESIIIGCNTVSHLAAGVFELQRTGDDTSGRTWAPTRKMGVNTLAFRMPQHGTFYAADADCVGLTPAVPWNLNRQWLELLAASGTPLFVSPHPDAITTETRAALADAFAINAANTAPAEPLDWMTNMLPRHWRFADGAERTFDWFAEDEF